MNRRMSLAAVAAVLFAAAAQAADPAITCESGKLKEAGKYGSCRLSAESKAVKTAGTPDYAKCDAKLADKWLKIETKAAGMCPSQGDQLDVQGDIAEFNACLVEKLAGQLVGACFRAVPATGQTTSFGTGDDGDVEAGATLSYVDNGDGTITDANTGLMWEKKVALDNGIVSCTNETGSCSNPHDADNHYTWSASIPNYNGRVVTIFLEQLNNRCDADTTVTCTTDGECSGVGGPCGFAGHRDWRLPNKKELVSIVDDGRVAPSIDPAFYGPSCGPACTNVTDPACSCTFFAGAYWTATTYANSMSLNLAWNVGFNDGFVGANGKLNGSIVRAVRGGA